MSSDKHSDSEKIEVVANKNDYANSNTSDEIIQHALEYDAEALKVDPAFEKRTLRKVDLRLIPVLSLCYAMSLVDRTNISNAYVSGMAKDLDIVHGVGYSVATLVFFPPYILLELPATYLVRRVGPALWMGTIVTLWGLVMISMGYVRTWHQLAACRALMGILEAGYFPAAAYLVSTWYIRPEIQKRMSVFYTASSLFGGFSSVISGGISDLAGKRGLNGWQWIFIIMGAMTLFSAIMAYLFVVDFPEKNKFLSKQQTDWIVARLAKDRGDVEPDPWTGKKLLQYFLTPRLWSFAFIFGSTTTSSYAFAYFLPIILTGMGYSPRNAQFLVAPPYGWSLVAAIGFAYISDKYRIRAPIIAINALLAILGLSLLAFHHNNAVRYFGAFLGVAGVNGNVAGTLGYMQNNVVGQCQRAFTSAIVVGFGGIGGIVASTVFRSQDSPTYRPGLWVAIGANILVILICIVNSIAFTMRNKTARAGGKPIEGRPGFYFTI